MKKALKLFIASLLTVSLAVATVVCCCVAPAVMAHFHKVAMCSHCHHQNPNNHPSNPAGDCRHQSLNAELSHKQIIAFSNNLGSSFPAPIFLEKHITTLPPPSSLVYPPGSPPLGSSLTPLYLQNLQSTRLIFSNYRFGLSCVRHEGCSLLP